MKRLLLLFLFALPCLAQTTVIPINNPRVQFFDASGAPLAGGLVQTYTTGTTNPLATYSNFAGMYQNTNPIVLDSGGYATIFLISGDVYSIAVSDANNVQQYSVNGVGSNNLTSPGPIGTVTPNVVEATEFLTSSVLPSATGLLRMASGDSICWRNAANNGDLCLSKNGSDVLIWPGGVSISGPITFSGALTVTGLLTANGGIAVTGGESITGQITSTLSTGTAPLVIASTTNVANLNASSLNGATFGAPGAIGGGTPGSGAFTTVTASTSIEDSGLTASKPVCTDGSMILTSTCAAYSTMVSSAITAGAISHTGVTSLASVVVAQPPIGCIWRVQASYNFSFIGGSNQNSVDATLWDGTVGFLPAGGGSPNSSVEEGLQASGFSSATYSTGTASVTVTLYAQSTTATEPNAVAAPGLTFGTPVSGSPAYALTGIGICAN